MALVLLPLPHEGFDPTEVAVPWYYLTRAGHQVCFATPDGQVARTDPIMLTGKGLGLWKPVLPAEGYVRDLHAAMTREFPYLKPKTYEEALTMSFDAILLPGGHAKGVKPYLESEVLYSLLVQQSARNGLIAAICHGVIVMGRAKNAQGQSLLYGRKTTCLLRSQELLAWNMTRLWMGDYYRTYPQTTVEDEVRSYLAKPEDFIPGPLPVLRDRENLSQRGFVVKDGPYISARWPGDAHRFSQSLVEALCE